MNAPNIAGEPADVRTERHASWAELFFDLVVVAGVAALAHVLGSGPDAAALGLYALLFLAFWLSWTTFMLYSNVAGGKARVVRLMIGMFGLGVMAASVPGVAHAVLGHDGDAHPPTVFAIAYIATRIYGSRSWRRGEVLLDFPVVQYSTGLLPWIVSIWVPGRWMLVLWAVGIGLDLLLILAVSGDKLVKQVQSRFTGRTKYPAPASARRASRGEPVRDSWCVGRSGALLRAARALHDHRARRVGGAGHRRGGRSALRRRRTGRRTRVTAPGKRTLITHIFVRGDGYLTRDAVFGVKESLITDFVPRPPGTPTPDGRDLGARTWTTARFDIVLAAQNA